MFNIMAIKSMGYLLSYRHFVSLCRLLDVLQHFNGLTITSSEFHIRPKL